MGLKPPKLIENITRGLSPLSPYLYTIPLTWDVGTVEEFIISSSNICSI